MQAMDIIDEENLEFVFERRFFDGAQSQKLILNS